MPNDFASLLTNNYAQAFGYVCEALYLAIIKSDFANAYAAIVQAATLAGVQDKLMALLTAFFHLKGQMPPIVVVAPQ